MSRTHYENPQEIEKKIEDYQAKRDRNLQLARWCKLAAERLFQLAGNMPPEDNVTRLSLHADSHRAQEASDKYQSEADHETNVTLKKLKAKLAEANTSPLPGIIDKTVAKK